MIDLGIISNILGTKIQCEDETEKNPLVAAEICR